MSKVTVKKRYLLITLALVLFMAVFVFIGERTKKSTRLDRVLVTIDTTEVVTLDYDVIKGYIGTLYAANKFDVNSKVAGRVVEMNYDIGDVVENGAIIGRIDDTQYRLAFKQAKVRLEMEESKVRQKEIAIDLAKREFDRMTALRAERVISESALEQAQYDFERQKLSFEVDMASLENQKTAVELSELTWSYAKIEARWAEDGTPRTRILAERFVDEGEIINQNKPIATIIDVGVLKAEIFVGESEYPFFKSGMKVSIEVDAFPGEKFEGEVQRVAPFLNEQTRQAKVQIRVRNRDLRLRPGMFARTSVVFEHRTGVQMLPKQCIVESQDRNGVYLYDPEETRVRFQPVQIGDVVDGNAEIMNVDEIGLPVVSVGQQMIRNGQLVRHARGDLLSVESKKKEISREKKDTRKKTRENSKKETQG
jgi:RND family efflux transporter MFP subunit